MKGMSIEQICTALGQHLSRMSRKVNIVFFSIATVLLILMALPATVDVLARYLFSYSVPGTVDITELALAMIIFGVMGYVNDNDSHIRVTLLLEKLPEHVRAVLRYSSSGLSVALFACMTYCMYANGVNKFLGNEGSYSISLPLYIFVFICTAFLIGHVLSLSAQTLLHLADLLRSRRYAGLLAGTRRAQQRGDGLLPNLTPVVAELGDRNPLRQLRGIVLPEPFQFLQQSGAYPFLLQK